MSKGFKYKYDERIVDEVDLIHEAYRRGDELSPDTRKEYHRTLNKTFGYQAMKKNFQTIYVPSFGLLLLIASLAVAFFVPHPSKYQSASFWMGLSFAIALSTALIPGFVEFAYQGIIRAGGGIAVFLIMYFWVPKIAQEPESLVSTKMTLRVLDRDTLHIQEFKPDIDLNSSAKLTTFCCEKLGEYYGAELSPEHFTCYIQADGKILTNEICRDTKEKEVVMIVDSLINKFPNKREAYNHFMKLYNRN